jgi:two-component system response regulator FixJ
MMTEQQISIVDDDADARDGMYDLLDKAGFAVRTYVCAKHFLADCVPKSGCLIVDIRMPEMDGLELQAEVARRGLDLPVIFITDRADVRLAVRAMKAGAVDFIEKPFDGRAMIASVEDALQIGWRARERTAEMQVARDTLALLTPRERHVLDQLVKGRSNKIAAYELGISTRTVEFHRARIMDKLHARNMSDLVRVALTAEQALRDGAVRAWRRVPAASGQYAVTPGYAASGAKS